MLIFSKMFQLKVFKSIDLIFFSCNEGRVTWAVCKFICTKSASWVYIPKTNLSDFVWQKILSSKGMYFLVNGVNKQKWYLHSAVLHLQDIFCKITHPMLQFMLFQNRKVKTYLAWKLNFSFHGWDIKYILRNVNNSFHMKF